ncbi:alpha/beta hydrolase [Fluviicola taffensis]|uniref:Phospholipase/Carboxylesterase n=1 Tax=Fluviicola taffensis (strain DSM 16823 / NCIMB 13979 / RW262) TaxID=755732 RepID=F2IIK8_FLUTR|nr:phospholipase/carboxylesterase [Fluviicola taffensis]AEA45970.1 phospholipase/Carboxylesterase [Fluviicola taffensis DSM 16823]
MNSVESVIEIPSSLRYRTTQSNGSVKHLVYLLHGYGQLVEYFSKKIENIDLENTLLIFPEGRHRFYLKGTSGRVGASWMTKEWREEDIRLNILGLDLLHEEILKMCTPEKVTVLGFSQGGATAARWVSQGKIRCNHFISWASVYPDDLRLNNNENLASKETFVVGTNDLYFPEDELKKLISQYESKGIQIVRFEGEHDIQLETLKTLL